VDENNWLDDREARLWRTYNAMRRGLVAALERQLTQRSRLSGADYELLVVLSETTKGRLRARELRSTVGWNRSRLAHQLRRMEARRLIRREACPDDARGTVVVLTSEGRRAIEAAAPDHVATVRRLFIDVLSVDEIDVLTSVTERVLARLENEQGD